MSSTLTYWNVRGLAQPIRLLLAFAGEEVEEKRYSTGEGKEMYMGEWLKDKESLGLDFPNIPHYKDDKVFLSQATAIFNYLARKHKLDGDTPEEQAIIDMVTEHVTEIRFTMILHMLDPEHVKNKETFILNTKTKMKRLETFLDKKEWFVGNRVTKTDIFTYEIQDWVRLYEPTVLDTFPRLSAFMDRFEALPQISTYMKSEKFIKGPVFGKRSPFLNGLE